MNSSTPPDSWGHDSKVVLLAWLWEAGPCHLCGMRSTEWGPGRAGSSKNQPLCPELARTWLTEGSGDRGKNSCDVASRNMSELVFRAPDTVTFSSDSRTPDDNQQFHFFLNLDFPPFLHQTPKPAKNS